MNLMCSLQTIRNMKLIVGSRVELLSKPENSSCIDYACFIHDHHILLLNTLHYSGMIQFDLLYCMIKRLKTKLLSLQRLYRIKLQNYIDYE